MSYDDDYGQSEQQMEEPEDQQGQQQGPKRDGLLIVLLVILAIFGSFAMLMSGGHNTPTPPSSLNTTTGPKGQFSPKQEAVYRLQDVNAYRQQAYNAKGNNQPDKRNLGQAELVAQKADGSTVILYASPIFWGSDAGGHSETLAAADVQNYVNQTALPGDVKSLHMLVVSQYNTCSTCVQNVRAITATMRQRVAPITLVTSIWMVNAYIDPLNPKTWVAPKSPQDITLVDLDR